DDERGCVTGVGAPRRFDAATHGLLADPYVDREEPRAAALRLDMTSHAYVVQRVVELVSPEVRPDPIANLRLGRARGRGLPAQLQALGGLRHGWRKRRRDHDRRPHPRP